LGRACKNLHAFLFCRGSKIRTYTPPLFVWAAHVSTYTALFFFGVKSVLTQPLWIKREKWLIKIHAVQNAGFQYFIRFEVNSRTEITRRQKKNRERKL
jgi:hypothetical protein